MPAGLKRTSSPIQVSGRVQETAANTFTSEEIDLTLNALDQEVFVVTQCNIDTGIPDADLTGTGGASSVTVTLSSTSRGSVGDISNSNVIAQAKKDLLSAIYATAGPPPVVGGVAFATFDREDPLFSAQDEDYIGIIATSNCFLNIFGQNNTNPKSAAVRIYGYRAKADASTYAALVQSQVLSQ